MFSASSGRYAVVAPFVCAAIGVSLISRLRVMGLAGVTLFLIGVLYVATPLSSQSSSTGEPNIRFGTVINDALRRISLGNGVHTLEVINYVDDGRLELGLGVIHWEKLLTALPGVSVGEPFSQQLQALRQPRRTGTTFASMTYFGILYADFGALGVVAGYALIGLFVAIATRFLFTRRKGVLEVAGVSLSVWYFADLSVGSSVSAASSWAVVGMFHLAMTCLARTSYLAGAPWVRGRATASRRTSPALAVRVTNPSLRRSARPTLRRRTLDRVPITSRGHRSVS